MEMKYCHVCISCKDWRVISQFYQDVFECRPLDPQRSLTGEWTGRLLGGQADENACIEGEHLVVPGYGDGGPTLEILSYKPRGNATTLNTYDFGFTHICFEVENDITETLEKFLAHGGTMISTFADPYKERAIYGRD